MRRLLIGVCAALLFVAGAAAQTRPKVTELGIAEPHSVIWIGNSFFYFNNGMGSMVRRLNAAREGAGKLRSTQVTIGGSSLQWHDVESYFRPNAIASFSFDSHNNIVFNKRDTLFDVAVMMDCSQCPIHPTLKTQFVESAGKDSAIVRKHGAKPVFFMSWAYADKPEMTAELAEAYTIAGNDNDALVIPAGLAFARIVKTHPEIGLYVGDRRHPTVAGSYLAACATYAALFKRSPVGLKYTAGLDEKIVNALQEAAWQTVREYYGR